MLKFFKGKDKGNLIYAPCKGRVVPLAEVPDPVFADKVLGDGFAVIPADGRIYAPADGEVAMVFDTLHAVTLTGLGAIMDVTVTISAAVGEIVRKNPSVSLRRLIHSGREIGYDIMGTMINVLLFVLASGMIPMFILKMNNDISFITIVRYHIPYDICRFLIESIGIVLAIPVSVFIASAIMKIPSRKRGVRE